MERFTMIASSYLILVRKGSVLLSRRKNTGYEDGNYSLPAGHVEDNESLTEAAAREIFEEIGIRLKQGDFTLAHVMHRKEKDIRMDFFFIAKTDQEPYNKEPHRCADISWFPINKLPANTVPYIRHAIQCYQKSVLYSEVGWRKGEL